jgi:hypothetical protein
VVLVLALLFFGGLAGIVLWRRSATVRGGPLALDARQDGEIDALGTRSMKVPGRDHVAGDIADVWTIPLDANQAYTIQSCAPSSGPRRYSPAFVVHGPRGPNDQLVLSDSTSNGGTVGHPVMVYTPGQSGVHSIWVYKPFNHTGGGYRIQVTRGARNEADLSLCM